MGSLWSTPGSLTRNLAKPSPPIRPMPPPSLPLAGAGKSPGRIWPPGRRPSPIWASSMTGILIGTPPADTVRTALMGFLASYDPQDDAIAWFDKVKDLAESMGFTANMKLYKQDPTAWPGSVADVSTFLRIALTGKTNSPDLYTVMQLLGPDRSKARLQAAINRL